MIIGGFVVVVGLLVVMARNRFGYGVMMIRTFIWIRMRLLGSGLRVRSSWISCLCRRI